MILELLRGGEAAELARKHGLSQAQLFAWRDRFLEGGQAALRTRRGQVELERDRRGQELERKVGQLTVENEILKKPTSCSANVGGDQRDEGAGRSAQSGVSDAGRLAGGVLQRAAGRGPHPPPQEPCDERLAQRIRTSLDRGEPFDYRRVWAWLRFQEGVRMNRKTVHRIMQRNGWQCRLW